ncbi:NAD(P)H-binding family protein [Ceratobasidium sp. AG-Ba]|nr:NAD(P)H-binding family protein [Ceratobasidium sp. AG-Ba]
MRILVLGGTGAMGIQIIYKALDADHIVTIYVRNPAKLPDDIASHESVIVNKGELTDEDSLRHSMRNPLAKAYSTILRLMREPEVACKRIILLGTVSIHDPADKHDLAIWTLVQGVKVTAYDAYADVVAIGETVKKEGDGLDWTVVRVPLLTKSENEETIAGYVGDGKMHTFLSRAGFAAFCLDELTRREWVRKMPMLSSK